MHNVYRRVNWVIAGVRSSVRKEYISRSGNGVMRVGCLPDMGLDECGGRSCVKGKRFLPCIFCIRV